MRSHPCLRRAASLLIGCWLAVFAAEPVALHACPVHDGPHSASQQTHHSQHAPEHHSCTCPGACCPTVGVHLESTPALAPARVVAFVEPEGCLITRFVEGETGRVTIAEAASLLRRLHGGRPIPGRFDALHVVDEYAASAQARGAQLPRRFAQARELGSAIAARLGRRPLAPCHNDLLAANFISDAVRTWIVDWEYAGMGDPAFDLANFAVSNGLDAEGDRALLAAYGSEEADVHVLQRYLSDFREAMWGVLQQAISTLDFDFAAYADEHFDRLEQTAAEPRFRCLVD